MIQELSLPGLWTWTPKRHEDERGWLSEVFTPRDLGAALKGVTFVQENQSLSKRRGVLRGLHFQIEPVAQAKLVRVLRGAIRDVAVDLRRTSPGFGRYQAMDLTAESGTQLFIPAGFAHGFVALEAGSEILYKLSAPYSPQHEYCLAWNDPGIGIDWKIGTGEIVLSDRDRNGLPFSALPVLFD